MKIKLFLLTTLCAICASCYQEEDTTFEFQSDLANGYKTRSINNVEEQKHPLIEGHYVDFINNQYVINITKEEAAERGISEESYDELFNSITVGNRLLMSIIDSYKSAGKQFTVSTTLYDDNNSTINKYSIPRIKDPSESGTLPNGRITTKGQEEGKSTFAKLPISMVYVNCNCYSNAALFPTQIVIANSWNIPDIKSGIGKNLTMKVKFSVTNVPGEIRYSTSDSNGGTCAWQGSKD